MILNKYFAFLISIKFSYVKYTICSYDKEREKWFLNWCIPVGYSLLTEGVNCSLSLHFKMWSFLGSFLQLFSHQRESIYTYISPHLLCFQIIMIPGTGETKSVFHLVMNLKGLNAKKRGGEGTYAVFMTSVFLNCVFWDLTYSSIAFLSLF